MAGVEQRWCGRWRCGSGLWVSLEMEEGGDGMEMESGDGGGEELQPDGRENPLVKEKQRWRWVWMAAVVVVRRWPVPAVVKVMARMERDLWMIVPAPCGDGI